MEIVLLISLALTLYLINVADAFKAKTLDTIEQKVRDNITTLYTEAQGNVIYLYEKNTNMFQVQAGTIEELAKSYLEIKNIALAKVIHNNQEIWFVEGDVLDEIELIIKIKD